MLPEVLLLVLEHLYNDDYPKFLDCLLVSKAWHQLALPILQKDVFLNEDNTRSFVDMLPRIHYKRIKSLTLGRDPRRRLNPQMLALIRLEISGMQKLQSLSYSGLGLTKDGYITAKLYDLCGLLKNLPATVRFLELASICFYDDSCNTEDHVCEMVASVLPQLRCLRLENTTVCPALFVGLKQSCERLEEINMQYYWGQVKTNCLVDQHHHVYQRNPESPINILVHAARSCIDEGKFPTIDTFTFDCSKAHNASDNSPDRQVVFDCLYKMNIIDQTTTTYPGHICATIETSWRVRDMWLRGSRHEAQTDGDLFITYDDLYRCVEGRTWQATGRRTRLLVLMIHDLKLQYDWVPVEPVK